LGIQVDCFWISPRGLSRDGGQSLHFSTIQRTGEEERTLARFLAVLPLSELHRLKGELLMCDPTATAHAEACFRAVIKTAREQHARLPELSTTTSHARLLARQGRRDEARTMLAEIYGWFTEGFDTADLKEAKALFEELNS
jgi:predicted ATPase